jgi:thiamine transporter
MTLHTSNTSKPRENLRALIESALLVAVGFVLSYVTLFRMPQGGSVTPLSMLPILMIGLRHGVKWGLCGGLIYSCLQMLQQFWPPPSGTVAAYIAVVTLDYILAFSILGLSGFFRGRRYGMMYAAPICIFLRFVCHFISGIVIWSAYAGETAAWLYSLLYNGSYMGVELALTTVVGVALCKTAPILFRTPGMQRT